MNRQQRLLHGLNLNSATGIEVGALDKPIVPPTTPGIFYVDHVDTPTLREKYADELTCIPENLVEVSGVWGEKTLAEAAAAVVPVDFFVASHVIEHVPDLIAWLQEIASVLKPSGTARLAIPDRRFTFDFLRSETVFADVLASHMVGARIPQIRQVIDHLSNVVKVDCAQAWAGTLDVASLEHYHEVSLIESHARDVLEIQRYVDVHCWVFTPLSFARLMSRMARLGYHRLACTEFHDTDPNSIEFFVAMSPVGSAADAVESWDAFAAEIERSEMDREQAILDDKIAKAVAVKVAEHQQRIDGLMAQSENLARELDSLRSHLAAVTQSNSWKITAPLRRVMSALR